MLQRIYKTLDSICGVCGRITYWNVFIYVYISYMCEIKYDKHNCISLLRPNYKKILAFIIETLSLNLRSSALRQIGFQKRRSCKEEQRPQQQANKNLRLPTSPRKRLDALAPAPSCDDHDTDSQYAWNLLRDPKLQPLAKQASSCLYVCPLISKITTTLVIIIIYNIICHILLYNNIHITYRV